MREILRWFFLTEAEIEEMCWTWTVTKSQYVISVRIQTCAELYSSKKLHLWKSFNFYEIPKDH